MNFIKKHSTILLIGAILLTFFLLFQVLIALGDTLGSSHNVTVPNDDTAVLAEPMNTEPSVTNIIHTVSLSEDVYYSLPKDGVVQVGNMVFSLPVKLSTLLDAGFTLESIAGITYTSDVDLSGVYKKNKNELVLSYAGCTFYAGSYNRGDREGIFSVSDALIIEVEERNTGACVNNTSHLVTCGGLSIGIPFDDALMERIGKPDKVTEAFVKSAPNNYRYGTPSFSKTEDNSTLSVSADQKTSMVTSITILKNTTD